MATGPPGIGVDVQSKRARALGKGSKGKGSSKGPDEELRNELKVLDQFRAGLKLVDIIGRTADKLSEVSLLDGDKGFGDVYKDLNPFFGLVREQLKVAEVDKKYPDKSILKALLAKPERTTGVITPADFGGSEELFATCSASWSDLVERIVDLILCYLKLRGNTDALAANLAELLPLTRRNLDFIQATAAQLGVSRSQKQVVQEIGAYIVGQLFRQVSPRDLLAEIAIGTSWWTWAIDGIEVAARIVAIYVSKGVVLVDSFTVCRVFKLVPTYIELIKRVEVDCGPVETRRLELTGHQ